MSPLSSFIDCRFLNVILKDTETALNDIILLIGFFYVYLVRWLHGTKKKLDISPEVGGFFLY